MCKVLSNGTTNVPKSIPCFLLDKVIRISAPIQDFSQMFGLTKRFVESDNLCNLKPQKIFPVAGKLHPNHLELLLKVE